MAQLAGGDNDSDYVSLPPVIDILDSVRAETDPEYIRRAYDFHLEMVRDALLQLWKIYRSLIRHKIIWRRLLKMYGEYETKIVEDELDEDEEEELDNVIFLKNRYLSLIRAEKDVIQTLEEGLEDSKSDLKHFKYLKEGWKLSSCGDMEIYYKVKNE